MPPKRKLSSSSSTSKKSRTSSQSSSAETYQSEKLTKSLSKMGDDLSTPCSCEQDCLDRFTIAELKRARIKYHSFNEVDKMNWLINHITNFYDKQSKNLTIILKGVQVCGIYNLLNISIQMVFSQKTCHTWNNWILTWEHKEGILNISFWWNKFLVELLQILLHWSNAKQKDIPPSNKHWEKGLVFRVCERQDTAETWGRPNWLLQTILQDLEA